MSKSATTIDPEWLHNSHAGEILVSEFMEPLSLSSDALATALGIEAARLGTVLSVALGVGNIPH